MVFGQELYCKMSKTRVGVVGSGIGGLMSAYILTKAGVDVVLYDTENSHAKTFTVDGVDLDLGLMAFNRVINLSFNIFH